MRQPDKDFYELPEIEFRGKALLTHGCRKVLEFTQEKVTLDMGNRIVLLYGRNLCIESFAGKRILLTGCIKQIQMRNKWEQD